MVENSGMFWEKPGSSVIANREDEVYYEDDFSQPSLWIPASEGQGSWEILTETPAQMVQYMGGDPMGSTTAANGFAAFNGIQFLLQGSVNPQDATLEYDGTFDFSGNSEVAVMFEQRYRAFNFDVVSFELSIDEGETWESFVMNPDVLGNGPAVQNTVITDVSAVAGNQEDVRFRFRWVSDSDNNGTGSGYGWMVDDMSFIKTPDNYLTMDNAYFDIWKTFNNPDDFAGLFGDDIDMVRHYEYSFYSADQVRPLNFMAEVTNRGLQPQTNVTFNVTLTDPDGTPHEFSESVAVLAPGEQTVIVIQDVLPPPFNLDNPEESALVGTYTVAYSVDQDEEEFLPEDNVVPNRIFRVDAEYISHSGAQNFTYPSLLAGANYEAVSRYSFNDDTEIDYIEFAVTTGDAPAEEALFQSINLNVFTGSVYPDQAPPNDELVNLFEVDQDGNSSLNYFITDTEIFNTTPSPADETQWVRVMFPDPIAVSSEFVYNAEIGVGTPPEGLTDYIWPLSNGGNPETAGHWFGPFEGQATSLFIGRTAFTIRLGNSEETVSTTGAEPVTFRLGQNYPNPTNGQETLIDWELLEPAQNITFTVHDMNGRVVEQRKFGDRSAGKQETIRLNADLAAGVYQYSLVVGNYRAVRKMVVTK